MTALGSPGMFHWMSCWMSCSGNRIHTPGMPGMTANHAPQCQPAASEKAMGFQGLGSIGRTAGIKTAGVRQQGRKKTPVAQDQQIWQAPHTIPAGAPPWKHDSGWALSTGNEARARVAGTAKNPLVKSHLSVTKKAVQFFPDITGGGPQNIPAGDQDDPQSLCRAGISGFTSGIPQQPL